MGTASEQENLLRLLATARRKLRFFSRGSYLRRAFTAELQHSIEDQIKCGSEESLEFAYWPPLFLFAAEAPLKRLCQYERDIRLVAARTSDTFDATFLSVPSSEDRGWVAGRFEVFAKAEALRHLEGTTLDVLLPNGRDTDILVPLGGCSVRLECTVFTASDEWRGIWKKYCEKRRGNPGATLHRPGSLDPEDAKGPGRYYNAIRLYLKLYDKLAPEFNIAQSQLAADSPNVLLLSFSFDVEPIPPDDVSVEWVFDELFDGSAARRGEAFSGAPSSKSVSRANWMESWASHLIAEGVILEERLDAAYDEVWEASRRLSGVLLFEGCTLKRARWNRNASSECALSAAMRTRIEKCFRRVPAYARRY